MNWLTWLLAHDDRAYIAGKVDDAEFIKARRAADRALTLFDIAFAKESQS